MQALTKRQFWFLAVLLIITAVYTVELTRSSNEYVLRCVSYARNLTEHIWPEEPCGCASCVAAPTNDTWFTERFKPEVRPLLSRGNNALSGNIYKYWQGLQYDKRRSNYTEVVNKLFQLIPGEDRYLDGGSDRCRVCSVVGNSGNLLGSHYGPLIDSADFVIRMNKAPIKGYERDVGTRTTHHILYPESAVDVSNDTNVVLFPFKTLDLEWLMSALTNGTIKRTRINVLAKLSVDKDKVMVLNPAFINYVHTSWLKGKGRYPSTGFLTLILSLHICDEVNVYGFGANRKGIWHHYFEPVPKSLLSRHTGQHPGPNEYDLILELTKKKKIQLFTGF
ncbi:CMP-N-acetylneuraminate-beta-galactosamide-alpha-2,3-sialyltransferase 1-like [Chanos chanos]|uniref:CMP-N-acetylneuraminate-beta-galactosamide-alpha-2,3-sialyltransferase 1 n=1 Tax=Chanos chanos TaxID=29144 RepID=A0A6J2WFL8_CHACN|nr:CMP-N-acetylneuraminate-beta-galactosamide-alpha-2,3-sialyltransferase 1-like [Chanos chanos]